MSGCAHPEAERESLFTARDYITGDGFEVCRCGGCGFVVTLPAPVEGAIAKYYPTGYYGSASGRRFPAAVERLQSALYGRRARAVERELRRCPGRVLDVGCGRGLLLRAFRERRWKVDGTELSESAAAFARDALKIPVTVAPAASLPWPDRTFDAVSMWHVLEHVPDPRAALREAARVLQPDGVLFAGAPNFGSPEARWARDKWFHLDVPRHLTHLTQASLSSALTSAGFEVRRVSFFAPEYDCFSFVQSALNRIGLRHNLLYNLLRGRGAKVLQEREAGVGQIALTLLLAAPLSLLSLPMTLLAGACARGATMAVVAVKHGTCYSR
ncbi:MAG TPA: class I SAM-dependent methyltransferase [Verrucomicrobiae bacterium]|nr:class I SAM-dependent methyltransferase [Verrucomicrobiae bacterium]